MNERIVFVTYRVGVHNFAWKFYASQINEALRGVGRMAGNADLPMFTWHDAATICKAMRQRVDAVAGQLQGPPRG